MKSWTIGNLSRRKADLRLDDETVSGLHASLTRTEDGRWMVEDRGSTNGTARLVGGQWVRIKQAYVLPDERLRFGRAESTVRQLVSEGRGTASNAAVGGAVTPWMDDLIAAFSTILSFSELKKNLLFVLDLISSPARHTMRCATRSRPVNPFSFMIFGTVIYMLTAHFGFNLEQLMKMQNADATAMNATLLKIAPVLGLFVTYTLVTTVIPFFVFQCFSTTPKKFDDFMRLMAVVNGMAFMLISFLAVMANEIANMDPKLRSSVTTFAFMLYVLFLSFALYLISLNTIALKHFWGMNYSKTILCSFLAWIITGLIVVVPLLFIGVFVHLAQS